MLDAVLVLAALGGVFGQAVPGQPPRDAAPVAAPVGTAVIRGRVLDPDSGSPIRRATVTLMPVAPPLPPPGKPAGSVWTPTGAAARAAIPVARSVRSDAGGAFEFTKVAAGSYRIRVSPGQNSGGYLPAAYGADTTRDPGTVVEVKDGQTVADAVVALRRGGAISGRIVDDNGDPLSRVMVFVSRRVPGSATYQRVGGGLNQSDDHGRYRVFGLEPGEYVVTAESRGMGGPPVEGAEPEGFIATHHPSVPHQQQAARVQVKAGGEVEAVDIQMIRTRTFRITGSVVDSKGAAPSGRVSAQLVVSHGSGFTGSSVSFEPQGRFTIRDVAPGEYTLVVQPGFGEPTAPGSPPARLRGEYATLPLSVSSDIENLLVVTQPGVSVSGTVVFADGDASARTDGLRVMVQPASRNMPMFGPPPSATVGADATFTLDDLHGPLLVRATIPRRDWALQAIMIGATDITDTPVEFRKEHSGHLQIVISTRAASIDGVVTGDDGAPAEQALIMVFPEEKTSWRSGSPRIRIATSMKEGKFQVQGLAAGRYYAVALAARSFGFSPDTSPEFFEALARNATRVVVAQDERRVVDLRMSPVPE